MFLINKCDDHEARRPNIKTQGCWAMVVIAILEELDTSTAKVQVQVSTLAGLVRTRGCSHLKTDVIQHPLKQSDFARP
jgi:hypothetical protein